ncbi:MAG: hypothetical protein EBR23_02070 [Planctomycetia bacterium]|nr:hypothetical protein [Planctomycetia bacterium]
MSVPRADIALLTDRRYVAAAAAPDDWYLGNILADDGLLQAELASRGLTSIRVDWADPAVEWSAFRCVVFRTTWDYFERLGEFSAWLDAVAGRTRLCNDRDTVRWNIDKHYLADLERGGVPVVPSRFIERGTTAPLGELLAASGWDEAVIKPCVSGAARHTYRVSPDTVARIDAIVRPLLVVESFLLQPFLPDVVATGEDTLVVIDGQCTHALRKRAKPGDFRVQDDHGGTVHECQPSTAQVELAERAMAACPRRPAYGRVDMVRDREGRHLVMELELVEPELWLRRHPPAAAALAAAIARVVEA